MVLEEVEGPQVKLIHNWKRAHRMASVRIAALFVAWGAIPPDMQAAMLDAVGIPSNRVPAVLGLLLILARLIDQPATKE